MIAYYWLFFTAFANVPQLDVTTLSGETATGELVSLTAAELHISQDGRDVRIPTSELLQIHPANSGQPVTTSNGNGTPSHIVVDLWDESHLVVSEIRSENGQFQVQHPLLGEFQLPRGKVHSVRFGPSETAVQAAWSDLQQRDKKRDYLVIRKGDVLDHLDGVIGELSDEKLKFLLDGDSVDVNRGRVYGWVYATVSDQPTSTGIRVDLPEQQRLTVSGVSWKDDSWKLRFSGAGELSLPAGAVRSIDFSAGKVLYLSSVEPRQVEHTPYFGSGLEWPYQRDRNLTGRPLRVGSRSFARGLAIHSRTALTYRLGGEYRRLTAVMGLDPDLSVRNNPLANNARVSILGDGKSIYEADVRAGEPPVTLDLPVENVRELQIVVDFGEGNLDIGDRVHFGDLRVLK